MPISGLDYLAPVRTFVNFFGRYGTVAGAIRGVWNGIIPVAVVDRYRDDTEGSLFGMTLFNSVPVGAVGAFAMGSPTNDWELLSMNWSLLTTGAGAAFIYECMVYTPDASYVPVVTPSPAGLFVPGLNTDWSFTLASLRGVGGHNPTFPARLGFFPLPSSVSAVGVVDGTFRANAFTFDPPLRVYRNVTLGAIISPANPFAATSSVLTILYRERPRTTDGPRTGV